MKNSFNIHNFDDSNSRRPTMLRASQYINENSNDRGMYIESVLSQNPNEHRIPEHSIHQSNYSINQSKQNDESPIG